MSQKANSGVGGVTLALLLSLGGMLGALLTALTALVVWLSGWMALHWAALVAMLCSATLALLSYFLVLHRRIKQLVRKFSTISYVADLIEGGYDWVRSQIALLLRFVERLLG